MNTFYSKSSICLKQQFLWKNVFFFLFSQVCITFQTNYKMFAEKRIHFQFWFCKEHFRGKKTNHVRAFPEKFFFNLLHNCYSVVTRKSSDIVAK